jgi:UDP-GlcNAc:undecaprenyl-phosphate GlcNAc-1-phosphate transferase
MNCLFTPLLIRLAHHRSWYDAVDFRKIHSGNIPRIGGVGIFAASFLAAAVLLAVQFLAQLFPEISTGRLLPLLIAILLMHVVGLLDDFANLKPLYKLYGQLIAALIPVVSGTYFSSIFIPYLHLTADLAWFGPVLTVLWLVGVTNAINLIDGIDGLSSSLSIIGALCLALCALHGGSLLFAGMSLAVAGATAAFFIFNFPPAKLFMGDAGSLYLGFVLALLPLYIFSSPASSGFALPVGMTALLIPILDTVAAVVRRRRKRKPFHIPDKEHLHHKLLNFGYSTKEILAVTAAASLLLSAAAYAWVHSKMDYLGDVVFTLWIITAGFFLIVDRLHRRT